MFSNLLSTSFTSFVFFRVIPLSISVILPSALTFFGLTNFTFPIESPEVLSPVTEVLPSRAPQSPIINNIHVSAETKTPRTWFGFFGQVSLIVITVGIGIYIGKNGFNGGDGGVAFYNATESILKDHHQVIVQHMKDHAGSIMSKGSENSNEIIRQVCRTESLLTKSTSDSLGVLDTFQACPVFKGRST